MILNVEFPHRVKMSDVARTAGVSVATVSKVVNGSIRRGSGDLGSGPRGHRTARVRGKPRRTELRSHRTNVLGILVAEFEPFSTELLKGASTEVSRTDYELLAYTAGARGSMVGWERRSLARLSGTLIDGAIIVTPTVVETKEGFHVVAIDPHTGPSGMPTVDSDNFAGAVLATNYLIGLGHRRIGFLGGRPDLESARLREAGFRKAMAEAGLSVDETLVRVGGYRIETAEAPARQLLSQAERPTAVFAANDLLGDRHHDSGARTRAHRPRRPVGHRLRQRARVGARVTAAHHDQAAAAADGRRGAAAAGRPHRRRRAGDARTAPDRAGRTRVVRPSPVGLTNRSWNRPIRESPGQSRSHRCRPCTRRPVARR